MQNRSCSGPLKKAASKLLNSPKIPVASILVTTLPMEIWEIWYTNFFFPFHFLPQGEVSLSALRFYSIHSAKGPKAKQTYYFASPKRISPHVSIRSLVLGCTKLGSNPE